MSATGDPLAHRPVDARVVRTRHDVLGATLRLVVDEGWEAVSYARLAQVAGYSRATLYKHWPTRTHLFLDAFALLRDIPHSTPTGDVRADLIAELVAFRTGVTDWKLDKALVALFAVTASNPEMVDVRDGLVADGEHVVRELLGAVAEGAVLEAAIIMLCGAAFYAAMMHGIPESDAVIAATVDIALSGMDTSRVPAA